MHALSDSSYFRVFMGEAVMHLGGPSNPILATDGLCSCIGFAGWEPIQKIGFLVHFGGPKQVTDFYTRGIRILSDKTSGASSLFHCILRGGSASYPISAEIRQAIHDGLELHESIRFEIIKSASFDGENPQSIALDLPQGIFDGYDHRKDPNPREKTEKENARDLTFSIYEELYYHYTEQLPNENGPGLPLPD